MSRSIVKSLSIKDDFAPLLKLAIPLVLTGLMESSVGFISTIFLAHLGSRALAAAALVTWLNFTLIVALFGIFSSINILISHKHGAKDEAGIALVLRDGCILALFLIVPAFLLFWNVSSVFLVFGQSAELIALADSYLHGLAWGLLPKFIMIVIFELFLGLGRSRIIMIGTMLSIPLYIFFNYALIFGKFGFPMLQIAGAGWGTSIAEWIITVFLCVYLLSTKQYRHTIFNMFTCKRPSHLWELVHLGLPMGLMYSMEVGFFFAMALLMGLIGVQSLAANQITMQYLGPLMGVVFCVAQAITVRMGHEIGAGKIESATRAAFAGIITAAIPLCFIAVLFWTVPTLFIAIDFDLHDKANAETIHFAIQFFAIAAFFQIMESIRIALFGALRGLKDTRFTLLTSFISFWCIALPIGYIFSIPLNFGGKGFWWAMLLGAICNAMLLYRRLSHRVAMLRTNQNNGE